ncbi:MAG TPA: hypothetical protein VFP63_05130, partial [Dehalococcoidia bacterium]|nr:hypothetical protein [Dehalococcoidia bacterium]
MTTTNLNFEWGLLTPEYILAAWAGVIIMVDLFYTRPNKEALGYLAAIGPLAAGLVSLLWIDDHKDFARLIDVNNYTTFFRVFFAGVGFFACI